MQEQLIITDQNFYELSSKKVSCGSFYNIHFFLNAPPIPVLYCDSTFPNLNRYLFNLCVDEEIITLDIEWNLFYEDSMIDLFQIATSKGVILIQNHNSSQELKEFLTSHVFYMKGAKKAKEKIEQYLGGAYLQTIDISKEYLKPNKISSRFDALIETYVGTPSAAFYISKIKKSNWRKNLNVQQICYAAMKVIGLCKAIPGIKASIKQNATQTQDRIENQEKQSTNETTSNTDNQTSQQINEIIQMVYQMNHTINQIKEMIFKLQKSLDELMIHKN